MESPTWNSDHVHEHPKSLSGTSWEATEVGIVPRIDAQKQGLGRGWGHQAVVPSRLLKIKVSESRLADNNDELKLDT